MSWSVYILECKDGTLYTGITRCLKRRLKEHNEGKGARYTRGRCPLKLVYNETQPSRREAARRELAIKRMSRQEKMELF